MKILFTLFLFVCSFGKMQAQQYQAGDNQSAITFGIKNFGVKTGGSFKGLNGQIDFDKANPGKASFNMTIDAATVNTDNDSRDSHLRKEEYFDVEKFPKISFVSEKITAKADGYLVSGKLTIKGTAKNISFPFKAEVKDEGLLFDGSFDINRKDFKVGGNSVVLGDNVTVKLLVFARKK